MREDARALWDYHVLPQQLSAADFVLALGSHDTRVAKRAAEIVQTGISSLLVVSGGNGKVTSDIWSGTEADQFAEVALQLGVEEAQILRETRARNTGDNVTFTRTLLEKAGEPARSGILVTKPYMMRRALATATRQWEEVDWQVAAPALSYEDYPIDEVPEDRMICLMVGDLQRIDLYAERGFQSPQVIPARVWESYHRLVEAGFDDYVITKGT